MGMTTGWIIAYAVFRGRWTNFGNAPVLLQAKPSKKLSARQKEGLHRKRLNF
jgi:hypothetical protein